MISFTRIQCMGMLAMLALSPLAFSKPVSVILPPEVATFIPSSHPGYVIAQQKCAICHSADYVNLQPSHMSLSQWTAEVGKMQHAYGAPLTADDMTQISGYLATTYGSEKPSTLPIIGKVAIAEKPPGVPTTGHAVDATALLTANACLGCHATASKVVGPAYKDVAAKYRSDPQALTKVMASIRNGGVGKWGAIPMPPYPSLSQDDIKTMATFVLKQ